LFSLGSFFITEIFCANMIHGKSYFRTKKNGLCYTWAIFSRRYLATLLKAVQTKKKSSACT
jgi:hypothetical protein